MTGKYTVAGSSDFDNRVDRHLAKIVQCVRQLPYTDRILEIVLLGGYGRGEGTPFKASASSNELPYNDYDLVVVSQPLWPWQHKKLKLALHQLGEGLEKEMGIAIDLYLHTTNTLKNGEPSLLNIEMKSGHQKIWGEIDALTTMPSFNLTAPPLSEGTRLLTNRGRLLLQTGWMLDAQSTLSVAEEALCRKYLYKNALAFGDCILIAYRDYDLLYRNKCERIESYRHYETIPHISQIIDEYQSACRFKLYGNVEDLPKGDLRMIYRTLQDIYPRFLLWYEGRRLGIPLTSVSDYCRELTEQRDANEPLFKTVILNMLLLDWRMFRPNPAWSLIHPRKRLPPAICLLLNACDDNQELTSQLLGCEPNPYAMMKRFEKLSMRLA